MENVKMRSEWGAITVEAPQRPNNLGKEKMKKRQTVQYRDGTAPYAKRKGILETVQQVELYYYGFRDWPDGMGVDLCDWDHADPDNDAYLVSDLPLLRPEDHGYADWDEIMERYELENI